MSDLLTKATTPYFPSNRDDERDFYAEGFNDARKGKPAMPPGGKESKRKTYLIGYEAGQRAREN